MKRICVFVGSRANWGRLKSLIETLLPFSDLEIIQGSFNVPSEYKHLVRFSIDGAMYADTNNNMAFTCSIIIQHISNYFNRLRVESGRLPDLAIVHGDRFENMGFAIAAAYNDIPLVHTEAGDISGNIDNKVRGAISALADIHFPVTSKAADNLDRAGYNKVYAVGSPALDDVKNMIPFSEPTKDFILTLYHPCPEDDFMEFIEAMDQLSKEYKIIWVNPNIDPGNRALLKKIHRLDIEFMKNLSPFQYCELLYNCICLVGNTSSGIKEGSYLGTRYILVGERQKGRELANNVIKTPCDKQSIITTVDDCITPGSTIRRDYRFGDGNASEYIVDILKEEGLV